MEARGADRDRAAAVTTLVQVPAQAIAMVEVGDGMAMLREAFDALVGQPIADCDHQIVMADFLRFRPWPLIGHEGHPPVIDIDCFDLALDEIDTVAGKHLAQLHALAQPGILVLEHVRRDVRNEQKIVLAVDHGNPDVVTRELADTLGAGKSGEIAAEDKNMRNRWRCIHGACLRLLGAFACDR
jgi:hypothetical protein